MQEDFHYYATYSAAYMAGFSHEECAEICYSANFPDLCSRTFLDSIGAPKDAATTQLSMEMADARTDIHGLHDITRIWASFHFLPYDLYAEVKGAKSYKDKYRLICGPNGDLVADTVRLAKGKGTQAAGIAMHVLADTWAHRNFVGTPSLVINNTGYHFCEIMPDGTERRIAFKHSLSAKDDIEKGSYSASIFQVSENAIMNLGHGRAGHLPDYSFIRYRYMPAWGNYSEFVKDNPSDYFHAFCQMVCALKYLHGDTESFEKDSYAWDDVAPYEEEIKNIISKRQLIACDDWKAFGEKLSGCVIPDIDKERYKAEYMRAEDGRKDETFLGKFIIAALSQKSMVTNKIFQSGNLLAGISVDYVRKGFRGIRAYRKLLKDAEGRQAK